MTERERERERERMENENHVPGLCMAVMGFTVKGPMEAQAPR
jgi:hypothetical protein